MHINQWGSRPSADLIRQVGGGVQEPALLMSSHVTLAPLVLHTVLYFLFVQPFIHQFIGYVRCDFCAKSQAYS